MGTAPENLLQTVNLVFKRPGPPDIEMLPREARLETQSKTSVSPFDYVSQTFFFFLMSPREAHNLRYLVIDVNEKKMFYVM